MKNRRVRRVILSNNPEANNLSTIIREVIDKKERRQVNELTEILKQRLGLKEEEITEIALRLQAEGSIKSENQDSQPRTLQDYLKTDKSIWFWGSIIVAMLTVALVFTITENAYPWVYVRNLFGLIFVLFLPGYVFTKTLFPANIFNGSSNADLEKIVRIALSVGMSLILVPVVGLLLYYSLGGLDLAAITFCLLVFTFVFSTAGIIRQYQVK